MNTIRNVSKLKANTLINGWLNADVAGKKYSKYERLAVQNGVPTDSTMKIKKK